MQHGVSQEVKMGYPFDEDEDYLSGANQDAYDIGALGKLGINTDLSSLDLSQLNLGNMVGQLDDLINFDPELLSGFAKLFPEDYKVLQGILSSNTGNLEQDYVVTDKGTVVDTKGDPLTKTDPLDRVEDDTSVFDKSKTGAEGAGFPGEGIKSGVKEWDDAAKKAGVELTAPPDNKGLLDKGKDLIKNLTGLDDKTINELGKYGLLAGIAKLAYDDAEKARQRARGWIAPGGAAKRSIVGPKGHVGYTKAAQGGVMSLAGGGEVDDNFLDINTPAGEATQYDIYGNMIMPDPYLRSMTEEETNQFERNAMREYYNNPENVTLANQIYQQLRDAVVVPGGNPESMDLQATLRNIYNMPEGQAIFNRFTDLLKYGSSDAGDLIKRDIELNQRETEGFTPDTNSFIPISAYELYNAGKDNPRIGHNLEREMLRLIDPDTPRTFFEGYNPSNYNEGFIRGGGGAGGGLNRDLNYEMSAYATGGVASLNQRQPFYLGGSTDGMTDEVPAHIDGKRPAALSDGEFVIPADVVSHLGNGNSNAGAQRLYEMMDQVRQARTGTTKQGKQINPEDFTKGVASFAGGGTVADQYGRKLTRANYEGKVDRQGIPDDDDDPFNYNPNAFKYITQNNELFLNPARNELDESVRANLSAQDPTGERGLIEKAYEAMPRDQLGNVFDQLAARDAWNVNQAAMGTAHESPWLLNPENRMMAVGIKDDIIGKPSVLLYNPNQGAGVFVNPFPRGPYQFSYLSGDPETDFQQALNLTPFEQYAMLNKIGPYSLDKTRRQDLGGLMTDEEEMAVYKGLKNLSGPLPKLPYQELERGYFNPMELNPIDPYAKKRANPEIREPYKFYQKYLNLDPVDNLLPLYLSSNPLKP